MAEGGWQMGENCQPKINAEFLRSLKHRLPTTLRRDHAGAVYL